MYELDEITPEMATEMMLEAGFVLDDFRCFTDFGTGATIVANFTPSREIIERLADIINVGLGVYVNSWPGEIEDWGIITAWPGMLKVNVWVIDDGEYIGCEVYKGTSLTELERAR